MSYPADHRFFDCSGRLTLSLLLIPKSQDTPGVPPYSRSPAASRASARSTKTLRTVRPWGPKEGKKCGHVSITGPYPFHSGRLPSERYNATHAVAAVAQLFDIDGDLLPRFNEGFPMKRRTPSPAVDSVLPGGARKSSGGSSPATEAGRHSISGSKNSIP